MSSPVQPNDRPDPAVQGSAARLTPTPSTMRLPVPTGEDLWVFAYGSLMWNPGFPYVDQATALLRGYHRRFCVASVHYRGTEDQPGLVLGLDRGGACRGVAFRVAAADVRDTAAYLWEREMLDDVYTPRQVPVLVHGHALRALTFVVDRRSARYCRALSVESTARTICRGMGTRGSNIDYLTHTVRQLEQLGIPDTSLHELLAQVRRLQE